MATSNFHNKNVSLVYALENDNIEDSIDRVQAIFERRARGKKQFSYIDKNEYDDRALHSYQAKIIGQLYSYMQYKDRDILVEVDIVIRSGYYEGANLDIETTIYIDGDVLEADELDSSYIHKRIYRKVRKLQNIAEDVYSGLTIKLRRLATFPNGETVYQQV